MYSLNFWFMKQKSLFAVYIYSMNKENTMCKSDSMQAVA